MKKIITSLMLAILFGLSANAQVPTNGLVGYWPFNGNANDASGYGNNGIVNGATLTTDRFGKANSAYQFSTNASNQYILVNSIGNITSKNVTISFWYNAPIQTTIYSTLYSWTNMCWANLGGGGVYGKNQLISIPGNSNYLKLSAPIENVWHHIVVNTDYVNQLTTRWVDGVKDSTFVGSGWSYNGSNYGSNSGNIYFGAANSNQTNTQFTGKLDDIRVYNRALTLAEITTLYNEVVNYAGFESISYKNILKVYPNPTSETLTIDCGSNYNSSKNYKVRIVNNLGQSIYESIITQQVSSINLNNRIGKGIFIIQLIDSNSNILDNKKIVLQ